MSKYEKVSEYAKQKGVSTKTVYRWLSNNDIDGKKVNGQWCVKVDDDRTDKEELVLTLMSKNDNLEKQLEYLQDRLQQAQDTIDTVQQRHDDSQQQSNMIIMQLTKQIEQQTLALEDKSRVIEDMRDRSLWKKIKAILVFAS